MMFSKKKEEPVFYCYECGCLLKWVSKTIEVKGKDAFFSGLNWLFFSIENFNPRNFCKKCIPSYDYIEWEKVYDTTFSDSYNIEQRYYKNQPNLRVTEEGKPIKK